MAGERATLLLRLAGPLQSWGGPSDFNRRDTRPEPTKSGIIGLLAAAQGRRRGDEIADLLELSLGVRVDQPGQLLRDYHTVSDLRGVPLLSSAVGGKGTQKATSPAKHTHVTQRFYLQDAVFVAAVGGPRETILAIERAVRTPAFPLALGRRSCVPAGQLVVGVGDGGVSHELETLKWQASDHARARYARRYGRQSTVELAITIDAASGTDTLTDVPVSFDPRARAFTSRQVLHDWVSVPSGFTGGDGVTAEHDPFVLLE